MIGLISNDLMFQSRISTVANSLGKSFFAVRAVDQIASRVVEGETLSIILLDLAYPQLDLDSAVGFLKQNYPTSTLVAYGPHVDELRLSKAVELGVDRVLTRGQFDRDLVSILQSAQ